MSRTHDTSAGMAVVALAALGVVFGDLGTSPLYTLKECFHGPHAIAVTPVNIMGVLSLIFWSLVIAVTVKYIFFVTKADHHGEGGTFALFALLRGAVKKSSNGWFAGALPYFALCSAALLYSDGFITPAISVLSAVEGLNEVTPAAKSLVVPLTCGILFCLFLFQKYGTARIGHIFGPVLFCWFIAIASVGVFNILRAPEILGAVNPWHAVLYFQTNHLQGMLVLGTVILCITGGEALYADMGHFSRLPIKYCWLFLVCPSLLLNYFGQGALLLHTPAAAQNPFYLAVPQGFLMPMVVLATLATVIASQALITGVYSLTQQAIAMGFLPRTRIVHTSSSAKGQVYLPAVNTLLMLACIGLVLVFKNSSGLAAAYGLAVTGSMGITSLLFFAVTLYVWKWPLVKAVPLLALFLLFDLPFLGANVVKIVDGGWLPLLASVLLVTVMTTWKKGRAYLRECFERMSMPLSAFLVSLRELKQNRSPGIGVYLTMNQRLTPMPLARSIALIHTSPDTIVLLTLNTEDAPFVPDARRISIDETDKALGVYRMTASYGYMEKPDVVALTELSRHSSLHLPLYDCTFYLGRETLLIDPENTVMHPWRKDLFIFLSKTAWNASTFFNIPTSRVVEIGTHLPV